MHAHFSRIRLWMLAFAVVLLASACNDSTSTATTTTPAAETLSGTAATGAAIVGTVSVVDTKGVQVNTTTATNGSFTATVTGMAGPFIVKVVPNGAGETLYSWAGSSNATVNVTPLTNLALFMANGNGNLGTLYNAWASSHAGLTAQKIEDARKVVDANFSTHLTSRGLDPATYNFFNTAFTVNGSGVDGFLDSLRVTIGTSGTFTVTVNNATFAFNVNATTTSGTGTGTGTGTSTGTIAGTWKTTVSGMVNGLAIDQVLTSNIPAANIPATQAAFNSAAEVYASSLTGSVNTPGFSINYSIGNLQLTYNPHIAGAVGDSINGTYKGTITVSGTANGFTIPPTTVTVDIAYLYERTS